MKNWLEKYENGNYLGTTSKPFNYNGAWNGPAKNGMTFYQNGLDWKPKTISKNGSIIQDNEGYWNPDNWGHPVEINSNQITMQGVYQPLIGISDTGDTKLMMPGENHKFKGKKVTEFPIAQNGKNVRQPIIVNDKNNPRLKAYNDSLTLYSKNAYDAKNFPHIKHVSWNKNVLENNEVNKVQDGLLKEIPEFINAYKRITKLNGKAPVGDKIPYKVGFSHIPNQTIDTWRAVYKKPVQPVIYKKLEPKKVNLQPVVFNKPVEQQLSTEVITNFQPLEIKKQPVIKYTGSPVYHTNGDLIGYTNQGDFQLYTGEGIKTETKQWLSNEENINNYMKEKLGEYYKGIKKQKNGGWLDKY